MLQYFYAMKKLHIIFLALISTTLTLSCSQKVDTTASASCSNKKDIQKNAPHRYGGWYCPDNLNGFPAVNLANWNNVPVVNGRMPTKEEAQNGISLIHVDPIQYPNAEVYDMELPQLAMFYCHPSKRPEVVIIIQAFSIEKDTIVGFRYLNGGNGSARLNEVDLIDESEEKLQTDHRFVTLNMHINAGQEDVWRVLTDTGYRHELQKSFDRDNALGSGWRHATNVNFHYANQGERTSSFGDVLYGSYYIQNVCKDYSEKFFIRQTGSDGSTLQLVCGPFGDDYASEEADLYSWALKVKDLVEGC